MSGYIISQLRRRPWRAGVLALGIIATTVGFVVMTGTTRTSSIQVEGTVTHNFRSAYDILVRPRGLEGLLERKEGLVRDNYLSGIYGGITFRQYHAIEHLPWVSVAAPIANVGTVLAQAFVVVRMRRFLSQRKDQLFRVRLSWIAQRGLSIYPAADDYVYVTHRPLVESAFGDGVAVVDPRADRRSMPVCDGFDDKPSIPQPFAAQNSSTLWCNSTRVSPSLRYPSLLAAKNAKVIFSFLFPLNVAAINPEAEARLVGLRRALVSGRYLTRQDYPRLALNRGLGQTLEIPALESSRTFIAETLRATIERLNIASGTDLPAMLASGACQPPHQAICPIQERLSGPPGHRHATGFSFLQGLHGVTIATRTYSADEAYASALHREGHRLGSLDEVTVDAYWRVGPAAYRRLGGKTLAPRVKKNGRATWTGGLFSLSGYIDQPTDNLDVQFRKLGEVLGLGNSAAGRFLVVNIDPIGRFDPARLARFSNLSKVPLETYYPPTLQPADAQTRTLLHGRALAPSQNLGDYIQQPALLLTNLAGLTPLLSSQHFAGVSKRQQRAPISVIRVRVAGVTGPNRLSQERIQTVAQLIHNRTGLDVDITAGSSPTPVTIALPRGRFGRPPLLLHEGWVKKEISISFIKALDHKDLALFALPVVICALFLANATLAAIRTRRTEIGTLRTLGWPTRAVFLVVLGELGLVGAMAGLAGAVLVVLLRQILHLDYPLVRALLVFPLAFGIALVAGAGPAFEATRCEPLEAIHSRVVPVRRSRAPGIVALSFMRLRQMPFRTALAAGGLALSIAALTVLLGIERAFRGTLVGTLLGNAISVQVHRADLVAAGLTVSIAALVVGDVLYLDLTERAVELATLWSSGWAERHLIQLILTEILGIVLLGSTIGLSVAIPVGYLVLGLPPIALTVAALIASAVGALAAFVAASLPLTRILRVAPSGVLASE